MTEEEVGRAIIGAAMKVHSAVGPGLLESAYETCLAFELEKQGIRVRKQVPVPIRYEDLIVDNGYRIDLLVKIRFSSSSRPYKQFCRCIVDNCSAICDSAASDWASC